MHSPLPDSSALEAGIIEDERPSRLSRVQDNVRNLLRASMPNTIRSSVLGTPPSHQATVEEAARSPLQSPLRQHVRIHVERAPSPVSARSTEDSFADHNHAVAGMLFPPTSHQQQVQHMAHQSNMFNTRAIAALTHPDLTDPSVAVFLQQKAEERHRRAWKRSRNGNRRQIGSGRRKLCSRVLCVVAGLLLAAVVATYLAIATSEKMSTTFHVLFILGILLSTIVFAQTLVRLCLFKADVPYLPRIHVVPNGRLKRRRHHRHHDCSQQSHHHHHRDMAQISDITTDYIPPTPIVVHFVADEVRPDSREAAPSAGADRASRLAFDKEIDDVPKPPPAYGRWRGSVRVNPDLLHWQAVPSPTEPDTPAMPSPTYAEAMAAEPRSQPPSYMTRESPARRREMQSARPDLAQAQTSEPEMVEGRGIGFAA
ncbi:hypothetical protein LTR53_013796 [Teratosphaeriaceae sp. CCFEE 6253]|nr:hypothetical protein LTR53_013796 [Teratosphaeriaceae sp. CCFEE 6253]